MSHTSLTSGWRRQNSLRNDYSLVSPSRIWGYAYQTTIEVYRTSAATTTVKIRPGTRPRTEYEYGNDMIARQMYSENSKAAVLCQNVSHSNYDFGVHFEKYCTL